MITKDKTCNVTVETFQSLSSHWLNPEYSLAWDCLFVLPPWLEAWWSVFGKNSTPYILAIKKESELIGIAPLMVQGTEASIMGSPNVCDYLDFVFSPSMEHELLDALFRHLRDQGITNLDLGPLRDDSSLFTALPSAAERLGLKLEIQQEDVSVEINLPPAWEDYLGLLSSKQRHEVRRKIRRLHDAGQADFRMIEGEKDVAENIETLMHLFGSNRSDKAAFMTEEMASFFRILLENMARNNLLKLFFLYFNKSPVAATICFDYKSTLYLYNNGYDNQFSSLSVSLLSKVFSLRDSIERNMNNFNFLKGDETYKFRLGGKPVNLYRCTAFISRL